MARVEAAWPEPAARVAMVVANRMVLSINAFLLSLRKIPREFPPSGETWRQCAHAWWVRHWPKHGTFGAGHHSDYRADRGRWTLPRARFSGARSRLLVLLLQAGGGGS